jgi:pimeloyl-ACP methyl ester carboxylesterase/DNA-binding CsgD family transcriptional regulator/PAS domain-containing protein
MDLIAASYRSLTDPSGFDEMLQAWNLKLDQLDSAGEWTERQLDNRMFEHLVRLASLAEAALPITDDPIREAVEHSKVATMVQSPEGRIVATNEAATQIFGATAGALDSLEWLHASSVADLLTLRRSVSAGGNRQRVILRQAAPADQADGGEDLRLVEARVLTTATADTGFIIITSLALPWTPAVGETLAEAFGYTDAELDVLRLFYLSRDLNQVAAARTVSVKTVRTQFKTILAKTESHSQANLLHIIAAVCARVAADGRGEEPGWTDPFGTEKILLRQNGKRLAYTVIGPASGRPLLWVHGPAFNGVLPQSLIDRLVIAGVRIILPCRPGYGNSDTDPSMPVAEDQAVALAELATALGLQDCVAVGTTCSAQALHLARDAVPHAIGTVVAISLCWKASPEQVEALPVLHRTLSRLATSAPSVLRSICSIGIRILRKAGPDWYVERAHANSALNQACLRNPETQALLRSDCRMMMAQGPNAFMGDLLLAYADTAPVVQRAAAGTVWLMGSEEQNFDRALADETCRRLSNVTLKVIPGCTELMLYQRPDLIAEAVLEALAL